MKGIVKSGKGDCKNWPEDLFNLYKEHSGLPNLKVGSLNLKIKDEYEQEKFNSRFTWNNKNITLKECIINFENKTAKGFIIRNNVNQTHPKNIIEIISDIYFKKDWNIKDGDNVEITLI